MRYLNLSTLKQCGFDSIIAANPNTSFPDVLTDADLADFGFAIIHPSGLPDSNPLTHGVREIEPAHVGGVWVQAWEVYSLSEETIAKNQAAKAELFQQSVQSSIQLRLDNFARTRGYDGILSACTYATSSVDRFKKEGQRCVDLRDQTWAAAYALMQDVQEGKRAVPTTEEEVMSALPTLTWGAA